MHTIEEFNKNLKRNTLALSSLENQVKKLHSLEHH